MSSGFDYEKLMHLAMVDVIKKILNQTAKTGLTEGHHFFINFATASNDVVMSPRLKDQYPEEMSIIIKNWYADLDISDEYFAITLNFGNVPENMRIPYNAIISFSDPSVDFSIRPNDFSKSINLNDLEEEIRIMGEIVEDVEKNKESEEVESNSKKGEVVSLDKFRKK